jgi:hypothetical protein
MKFINLEGKKFNLLTVIEYLGNSKWLCRCDCGNLKIAYGSDIKSGHTKSCGCLHTKHNKFGTRLYNVWWSMKSRCYYKNQKCYKNYGGRGIKVCNEWKDNFENFYNWAINNGYKEDAKYGECMLDRVDVNKDYCPLNCRFVDMKTQQNNRRNNKLITYNEQTKNLTQWSRTLNISKQTLLYRIYKAKWNIEKALFTQTKK